MIKIIPTPDQIEQATIEGKELGKLKNSITSGEGNAIGFLGEIVFAAYFNLKRENTFEYDVKSGDIKIDIKTQSCNSEPKLHYYVTIADYNIEQNCDLYTFTRILEDFSVAWILGWYRKENFYKEARFFKLGEEDLDSPPHKIFYNTADCWKMKIGDLNQLKIKDE